MPNALAQAAQNGPLMRMGWVNPPAGVTSAISALQHQCEAWPKTPVSNPLALASGTEDAVCQAVTGHAFFVPEDLAPSVVQVGALMIVAFVIGLVSFGALVGFIFYMWVRFFGPPGPRITSHDPLSSIVVVIGWFGWLSASGLAAHYSGAWAGVFIAAAVMWIFVTPHLVSLLRNRSP